MSAQYSGTLTTDTAGLRRLLLLSTEHEAANRGDGIIDRAQEIVYKKIAALSLPGNTVNNILFRPDAARFETSLFDGGDLPSIITELTAKRLILALPGFEFQADSGELQARTYLVARRNDPADVVKIFEEVCDLAHEAIVAWMLSLVNVPDALRADLERDLGLTAIDTQTPTLHVDQTGGGPEAVFDPLRTLMHATYPVMRPRDDVLRVFGEEQRRRLLSSGQKAAVLIEGSGFLPLRDDQLLTIFESAGEFLDEHVVPLHLEDRDVKRALDRVSLEEALYDIETTHTPTGRFLVMRAEVLKQHAFADAGPGKHPPGRLAAEIVLRLGVHAEQKYTDRWKIEAAEAVEKFREKLFDHRGDWKRMLRYVYTKEVANFHPDIWTGVCHHADILHVHWEMPTESVHIFAPRDFQAFRKLVRGMVSLPAKERWRITALRALIEAHEPEFRSLFSDEDFVRDYGRLLRKAYIDYMPVYLRILLYSGIRSLLDYFFDQARERVRREQALLAKRNASKFERFVHSERDKRRKLVLGLRDTSLTNEIIHELERRYFEVGQVPLVSEALAFLPVGRDEQQRVLKNANFKVLPYEVPEDAKRSEVPAPGGTMDGDGILLFPKNGEYPAKMNKLRRCVEELRNGLEARERAGLLDAAGKDQLGRCRAVHAYLERSRDFVVRGGGGAS